MTAEDQAASIDPAAGPGDARAAARAAAREALSAGRRRRAAGHRRELDARADQVRRARTRDEPADPPEDPN